jgi:hypothetical protein
LKYRIYIDETGNPDLESSDNPLHRYLGLTGIIIDLNESKGVLTSRLNDLKARYFSIEYDEPIILHRKDILKKKPPFSILTDPKMESNFNSDLLKLLRDINFKVVSVVIDKLEHKQKYSVWRHDPYHYCLEVLMERFVLFLEGTDSMGDAMAESRGGKADRRLKDSFLRLYKFGTDWINADRFKHRLTSKQLKVKPKVSNIAALQLADLIAHPSRQEILHKHGKIVYKPERFGNHIIKILNESKYDRGPNGKIEGFGRKMLP